MSETPEPIPFPEIFLGDASTYKLAVILDYPRATGRWVAVWYQDRPCWTNGDYTRTGAGTRKGWDDFWRSQVAAEPSSFSAAFAVSLLGIVEVEGKIFNRLLIDTVDHRAFLAPAQAALAWVREQNREAGES